MRFLLLLTFIAASACAQLPVNVKPPAPPVVQVPKMEIERVPLQGAPITGTGTLSRVLAKLPAPNTAVLVFSRASVFGSTQIDAGKPAGTTDTLKKTIVVTVPDGPYTAGDEIVIIYWTLE